MFHFKDGSLHEETAVYSQHRNFRLLSGHLIQKGPTFPHPMEVSIDVSTGRVTVHTTGDGGKEEVLTEHLKMPSDVANGMVLTILKNIQPDTAQMKVSMVAATPKPRLVKLVITPRGEEPLSAGGASRKAAHYGVHV